MTKRESLLVENQTNSRTQPAGTAYPGGLITSFATLSPLSLNRVNYFQFNIKLSFWYISVCPTGVQTHHAEGQNTRQIFSGEVGSFFSVAFRGISWVTPRLDLHDERFGLNEERTMSGPSTLEIDVSLRPDQ